LAPRAIALDKRWTRGVPDRWPEVGRYLEAVSFVALLQLLHRLSSFYTPLGQAR
jgi:hypothetical protein